MGGHLSCCQWAMLLKGQRPQKVLLAKQVQSAQLYVCDEQLLSAMLEERSPLPPGG